ncbi:hypothetical protein AB0F91_44365 [Amycolatopsis sp. NPDC023774]|uniref:hypothetical protein n=1 Tax=Amycolatopsis sp. NPDC023774 TaxID=3155015 RepID=UPI0033FDD10D
MAFVGSVEADRLAGCFFKLVCDPSPQPALQQSFAARLARVGAVIQRGIDRGELPRKTAELLPEAPTGSLHLRIPSDQG